MATNNPYEVEIGFINKPVWCDKYKGKLPNNEYPYWCFDVKDKKTGKIIKLSIGWEELGILLAQAFAHEKSLDIKMNRNSEHQKWYGFIKDICNEALQNKLLEEYQK